MNQKIRIFFIVLGAEATALALSLGVSGAPIHIFLGLNAAFLTAGMIVQDHEARGRGE